MEPHSGQGGERRDRRRAPCRTAARVRLHEVRTLANPREVGLRYLPPPRGHTPHPAHVFLAGPQTVGLGVLGGFRDPPLRVLYPTFACGGGLCTTFSSS